MGFEQSLLHRAITKQGKVPRLAVEIASRMLPKQELAETLPDLVAMQSPKIGDRFPPLDKNTLDIVLHYASDKENYAITDLPGSEENEDSFILSHKGKIHQQRMIFDQGQLVKIIEEKENPSTLTLNYTEDGRVGYLKKFRVKDGSIEETTWKLVQVKREKDDGLDDAIIMSTHLYGVRNLSRTYIFKIHDLLEYTETLPGFSEIFTMSVIDLDMHYSKIKYYQDTLETVGISPIQSIHYPLKYK